MGSFPETLIDPFNLRQKLWKGLPQLLFILGRKIGIRNVPDQLWLGCDRLSLKKDHSHAITDQKL